VNGKMLLNNGGGKLLAFDLNGDTATPVKTINFPIGVAYPDTFLNDIRFDLRPQITRYVILVVCEKCS
jgi:hypothetical protein